MATTEQKFLDYPGLEYYHQQNIETMDEKDVSVLDNSKSYTDSSVQAKGNELGTRIDNLILNAGDSSAECADARVTKDGTVHDTLKNRLDTEYSQLSSEIFDEVDLIGTLKTGFFNNGNYNATAYTNSIQYDVSSIVKVNISVTMTQYYNIYTFLDVDNNIISYLRAENSKVWEDEINVPDNAVSLVICGNEENVSNAVVIGQKSLPKANNQKVNKLESAVFGDWVEVPRIDRKIGGWSHDRNHFEVDFHNCVFYMFDVENLTSVHLYGDFYQFSDFYVLFDKDNNVIDRNNYGNPSKRIIDVTIDVTNAFTLGLSTALSNESNLSVTSKRLENSVPTNQWKGKKIVWFGTSIPCGTATNNYPKMVGELLGTTVYNEAVGSSAVHCKRPHAISESNPYGFSNNWPVVSRCLSNTVEEMQWAIDNFDNTDIFSWLPQTTMTEDDKSFILGNSYENKLNKYLTPETEPDLWVFDHGHNDEISEEQEAYYTDETYGGQYSLYCFRGAMNFLINKIKEYNPFARIVIIGEYENQKRPLISQYQKVVADDWSFPLYEQWDVLGWSQKTVQTTGYWNDGLWVPSGGSSKELTYLDLWLPDKTHPHSDKSGRALHFMATNIAEWLKTIG